MPYITVNLPALLTPTTSSTATSMSTANANFSSGVGVGLLDDASSITIFVTSSAGGLTSGSVLQVAQFDPAIPLPVGVVQSTNWFNYSLTTTTAGLPLLSSGAAFTVQNISFRGIRISMLASGDVAGEVIAYLSKQITV